MRREELDRLDDLCKDGISPNERDLAAAVPALVAELRNRWDWIPWVQEDESGSWVGCTGHVEPQRFVKAVQASAVYDGWWDSDFPIVIAPEDVRQTWRYDEGPDTERMPECDADHPGAVPFTECRF